MASYQSVSLTISGGTFTNNTATEKGGAFATVEVNQFLGGVTGGTYTGNKAKNGGAMYISNGDATVSGVTMTGNTATASGGAIYKSTN